MEGVLYVSHGTRLQQGVEEAHALIDAVKKEIPIRFQETCFLEITSPNIQTGVAKLVQKGVNHIYVIPVLLLSAGHYYRDIPLILNQLKSQYQHIDITLGRPLGVQQRLVEILKERIQSKGVRNRKTAQILLVGRGSYYKETEQDMQLIRSKLKQLLNVPHIKVCYLAAAKPQFEEAFKSLIEAKHQEIIVVPYLWFSGFLTWSIEKTLNSTNYQGRFVQCDHLGHHQNIINALKERVLELIQHSKGAYDDITVNG
ncbi:sirohydrochlorin chelatase [Staphylococcus canis]|uniref:Sirohydrochlorin chelatase n=1 Tax=Staphylococcus canis TaxID=2724942 RepID=A0ABS0T628_9STAP|nr:sirohydrochlorin chelatase [Staphylococcus canis]MBI5974127.1 sirohydrochlorin chelatase [Staphylococcus canis]